MDQFGAAVDALHVGGVVELVARIPALFLDSLSQLPGFLRELFLLWSS